MGYSTGGTAPFSGSLQEVANVATSKSRLDPSSLTPLAGKAWLFLNNSMISGLQLGPNTQPRGKSLTVEKRSSYSLEPSQLFTSWT